MSVPEHRAGCEFRIAGRTLSGVVLRYGDVSPEHRERFVSGAFAPVPDVGLNIQHDQRLRVLDPGAFILTDTLRELRIRAELPAGSAALSLARLPQLSHDFDDFSSFDSRSSLISLSPIFVTPL